jgi:hypothetical protein
MSAAEGAIPDEPKRSGCCSRISAWVRPRPEVTFLPLTALMLSVTLYYFGWNWVTTFFQFLGNPGDGPIFPLTWSLAWGTFLATAWLAVRRIGMHPIRALMVGLSVPFGATGLFELVYQEVGAASHPGVFYMSESAWIALVLWASLGLTGTAYWSITRIHLSLVIVFLLGFIGWEGAGYPQVVSGGGLTAWAFNLSLKAGAYVIVAMPLWVGLTKASPKPPQPEPSRPPPTT